jgi:guanylate kinase
MSDRQLIIVCGPSAGGKTTITKDVLADIPKLCSQTTREPREGEVPGTTYYYVSEEEFFEKDLVEQAPHEDYYYSLGREEIEEKYNQSEDGTVFVIMNKDGIEQMKENYDNDEITVVYVYATRSECFNRMIEYRDWSEERANKRLDFDKTVDMWHLHNLADHTIYNHDGQLNYAKEKMKSIVK